MCYRASTPKKSELKKLLSKDIRIGDYQAHYHAAGFDHPEMPVMTSAAPDQVQPVTWGFTPELLPEAEALKFFKGAYSLNARAETIFSQALYKTAATQKRCLVFVDGFFEWKHELKAGKTDKVPHYIQMPDHKPFALGGLWSERDGTLTCNILTTPANELMTTIHNSKKRMPFILAKENWGLWLDPKAETNEVKTIIHKFPEGFLEAHEISSMITDRKVEQDVPEVQQAI